MIDTVSTALQIFVLALSFGALVLLARAQRPEKQPVPVSVEHDPRER